MAANDSDVLEEVAAFCLGELCRFTGWAAGNLWLLDDAITGRVRFLRFAAIAEVEQRQRWPLRRSVLRVRAKSGRRHAFAGLRPDTAAQIAIRVRAAVR